VIADAGGERHEFVAHMFFSQHNLFIMVTGKKAARLGRSPGGTGSTGRGGRPGDRCSLSASWFW